MRFPYPLLPAEFEIPDEWWTEAGMTAFMLAGPLTDRQVAHSQLHYERSSRRSDPSAARKTLEGSTESASSLS